MRLSTFVASLQAQLEWKGPIAVAAFMAVALPLIPFNFLAFDSSASSLLAFTPFVVVCAAGIPWIWSRVRSAHGAGPDGLTLLVCVTALNAGAGVFGAVAPASALGKTIYYCATGEFLLLLVGYGLRRQGSVELILGLGLVACSVVGVVGLLELTGISAYFREIAFSLENPAMAAFSGISDRPVATIGNPLPLGAYLSLCVPLFLWQIAYGSHRGARLLCASGLALVAVLLVFTTSRGAWIAGVAGVAYYFGAHRARFTMPLLLAVLIALAVFRDAAPFQIKNPYTQLVENYETYHRSVSVAYATAIWSIDPLFGVGLGNYRHWAKPMGSRIDSPDNMYLMTLAESGFVGLALRVGILSLLLLALRECQNSSLSESGKPTVARDRALSRAFSASMVGACVNMWTWDVLYFPVTRGVFWLFAGLAIAHVRHCKGIDMDSGTAVEGRG